MVQTNSLFPDRMKILSDNKIYFIHVLKLIITNCACALDTVKTIYSNVAIPPISTKQVITSQLSSLNLKKTMIYDDENPDRHLGQAQKCGRSKPVNGLPCNVHYCYD